MPTPDEIRTTMETYIKALSDSDVDTIMDLYADECSVEDPVGAPVKSGRDTLRAFYVGAAPSLHVEITGPIRVAGAECAAPLVAELSMPDTKMFVDVIDVMTFDDNGKITSMRAYWNPADMRPTR